MSYENVYLQRTAATSKVELFVIKVNDFQALTIISKSSTLDVAAALDAPLKFGSKMNENKLAKIQEIRVGSMYEDPELQRCKKVDPKGVQPKPTEYLWLDTEIKVLCKIVKRGVIFTIS